MIYDIQEFTYGAELEYGDVYRFDTLPEGASWNAKDYSIVSSTGIANDPSGKLYAFGGEINTKPTQTISEQLDHIESINTTLYPKPIINYRSNLHIHVGVPGLKDDLDALKRLLVYIDRWQDATYSLVEPIPVPNIGQSGHVYDWELKRYKRRLRSHQFHLPAHRVKAMLRAETPQQFFEEHAVLTSKGRMWYFMPRAGINLRQLWETSTVEFRHFPGTLDIQELDYCLRWCQQFLYAAIVTGESPVRLAVKQRFLGKFPKFQPYDFEVEQLYQFTNLEHNKRSLVADRLEALCQLSDIDHQPAEYTYNIAKEKGLL